MIQQKNIMSKILVYIITDIIISFTLSGKTFESS